jgi:LPXTG-motif cell wall-anchored protein
LNGNDKLSICEDTNGYDEYFGIPKTNFGKGTLIIRHTDHQNHVHEPVVYTDYLSAQTSDGAAIEVRLFEEGDYEVALDYEIIKHNWDIFGWDPIPEYFNYRIFFRFSVRNGNCMVYPFDVTTGAELTDSSLTENGFYLDLAKSKYLDINIKRSVRTEGAEGVTEDTRFNKPAKDGEDFTDEGIYTITVHNKYTDQTTTKVIYVGTDNVLKAHVVTGLPINDIEYRLSMGATVMSDGTIVDPPADVEQNNIDQVVLWLVIAGVLMAGVVFGVFLLRKKKVADAVEGTEKKETEAPVDNGGVER